jgi:lipopolysaccharide transport system permease protein
VYFPRALLPSSSFILNSVESLVTFVLLFILWIYYGYVLPYSIFILLLTMTGTILMSWGLSLCLSGINMRYRDFNYIIPILLRLGLIITPIAFSITEVPENWSYLLYLNPATPFIELFRFSLWGSPLSQIAIYTGLFWAVFLPFVGLYYLNYLDSYIADIL